MTESRIGQVAFEGNAVSISSPGFKVRISDVNVSCETALTEMQRLDPEQRDVVREGFKNRLADGVPPIGFEEVVVKRVLKALGK